MATQRAAMLNSPKIIPRKNGFSFIYRFTPPYFITRDFTNQAIRTGNQKALIVHEDGSAYPSGWSGHHQYSARIAARKAVTAIPTKNGIRYLEFAIPDATDA